MTRKNYSEYKDGLPVLDLTEAKLKYITEKHMCVKATLKVEGKNHRIRVRLKPKKNVTLKEEVQLLRAAYNRLLRQKGVTQ